LANGQHTKVTLPVLRKLILSDAPVAVMHADCWVIMSRLKVSLAVYENLEQRASVCLETSYRPGFETLEAIVHKSDAVTVNLSQVFCPQGAHQQGSRLVRHRTGHVV